MKKKLLISVGAGASIDFGMPSVGEVDKILDQHAGKTHPLVTDPPGNLYGYCRDAIDRYYEQCRKTSLRKWVNFEEVLYQLNLLIPYLSDPFSFHGSNALLKAMDFPAVSQFGQKPTPVDGNVLRTLAATLMDALADKFVDACEVLPRDKAAELAELRDFIEALKAEFDIGFVSLNYDDVIMQAVPGLHTGFNPGTGEFDPRAVFDRAEWDFIYHLHGSIHYAMTGGGIDIHRISWRDRPEKDNLLHAWGRNPMDSMEGTTFPMSPVVAGYGKPQQILRQPFRTYFAQLNRLVHEADAVLFLGYGFSDSHLNAAFSEIRDRARPIVLVSWADDYEDPLPSRHDRWSNNMLNTLATPATLMSAPGTRIPAFIGELKSNNDLEVSSDPKLPLAVWYKGMIEACRHPEKIVARLV